MNISWNTIQTWIAQFDILGFKNRINNDDKSLLLEILKSSIDASIADLRAIGDVPRIYGFQKPNYLVSE